MLRMGGSLCTGKIIPWGVDLWVFPEFPAVVWGFNVSWGDLIPWQPPGKVGGGTWDVQQERGFSTTVTFSAVIYGFLSGLCVS